MNYSTNKTFILSLMLLGLGVVFFIIENLFYQYIDNRGVLHESVFMPLGGGSLLLGVFVLFIFIIQKLVYWFKNN